MKDKISNKLVACQLLKDIFDFVSDNELSLKSRSSSANSSAELLTITYEYLFEIYGYVANLFYDVDSDYVDESNLGCYRTDFVETIRNAK